MCGRFNNPQKKLETEIWETLIPTRFENDVQRRCKNVDALSAPDFQNDRQLTGVKEPILLQKYRILS